MRNSVKGPVDDSRADLVRLGLAHLQNASHHAISIRSLCVEAKLSSGAPYYHFRNRRGLLVAIALEGFGELNALAAVVVARPHQDDRQRLLELSKAFIAFSDTNPFLFDLMYESELTHPVDAALQPAFRRAYDMLVDAVFRASEGRDRDEVQVRAVALWTTLFGLARLQRYQLLEPFQTQREGEWRTAIIDEAVQAALRP